MSEADKTTKTTKSPKAVDPHDDDIDKITERIEPEADSSVTPSGTATESISTVNTFTLVMAGSFSGGGFRLKKGDSITATSEKDATYLRGTGLFDEGG